MKCVCFNQLDRGRQAHTHTCTHTHKGGGIDKETHTLQKGHKEWYTKTGTCSERDTHRGRATERKRGGPTHRERKKHIDTQSHEDWENNWERDA